jgi:ribosomal protein S8
MTNYNFADLLVRIKVAYRAHLKSIKVLKTKLNIQFLYLLYKIGLLKSFYISQNGSSILIFLKYKKDGQPLIHSLDLISKPSNRVY